jgi:hypothetical protein
MNMDRMTRMVGRALVKLLRRCRNETGGEVVVYRNTMELAGKSTPIPRRIPRDLRAEVIAQAVHRLCPHLPVRTGSA